MMIEIDTLGHFAPGDREQNSTSAVVAGTVVVVQRQAGLRGVLCLDEDEFVPLDLVQNSLIIPAKRWRLSLD